MKHPVITISGGFFVLLILLGGSCEGFSLLEWLGWTSKPATNPNECLNPSSCQFNNGVATQYLTSCNGQCVCMRDMNLPADAPSWRVVWDGQACTISETGPCGVSEDGRMLMGCHPGLQCIEKRCRNTKTLQQAPEGASCYGDIDCQKGLICKITSFHYGPSRTCVDNATKPVPLMAED